MQDIFNGLAQGGIYALTSIGLVLIFSVVRVPNFAHGETVMVGGMTAVVLITSMKLPLLVGMALGATAATLLGLGFAVLFSRFRKSGELTQLIVSVALVVIVEAIAAMAWGDDPRVIPNDIDGGFTFLGARMPTTWALILFGAVAAALCLAAFVKFAPVGRVMRAMALNPTAAELMGIPIGRYRFVAFGIGSALAGLAGCLYGLAFPVQPSMGGLISLKAFIVIIFSGMGSIMGALAGGLLLGLIESIGAGYVSGGYSDTYGFVFLLAVLLLRPQGLFVRRLHDRT